jgi:type II secretory pathway component GspD/PulD (secretin)
MGGLKRGDKTHTKKGFPGLMDLPWIGPMMFSRTADSITNTEIVIFITPKIVTGAHDYHVLDGQIKPFKAYSTDTEAMTTPVQTEMLIESATPLQ